MDSDAPEKLEMTKVDIATEADKLLLQMNKLVDGDRWNRIAYKDFCNTINFNQKTETQKETIKYLLDKYLFKHKNFLAPVHKKDKTLSESEKVFEITPLGFEHIHEMLTTRTESQTVFCAMWFHSDTDSVWEEAIKPSIEETGHTAVRIDKEIFNEDIIAQMIMYIRKSKFVVADLTGNRGGVYYEAGFARGLGLEVIYTCREDVFNSKETEPHFDVAHLPFIKWNDKNLSSFKKDLMSRIVVTILGKEPIR